MDEALTTLLIAWPRASRNCPVVGIEVKSGPVVGIEVKKEGDSSMLLIFPCC